MLRQLVIQASISLVLPCLAAAEEAVADCSTIATPEKRLACFDAQRENANAALKARLDGAQWTILKDVSKIDDSLAASASVTANSKISVRYSTHQPSLWIRCLEHTTTLFIDFDGAFVADSQGFGDVTFRADKEKARTYSMKESTDHQALGLWSGGRAIPAIKSLFDKSRLIVRATPYNESPQLMAFDVSGLRAAVTPVREACKW